MPVPAPPDPGKIDPLTESWPADRELYRVHVAVQEPNAFNTTGSAGRFRPFRSGGRVVPTLYAAPELPAALSETVFHDIPPTQPDQVVLRSRLYGYVRSVVTPTRGLTLISLRGNGLRRLRTTAADLIHTDPTTYPATARYASSLYRANAHADGIVWDSRLHPGTRAMLLFGTRVRPRQLAFEYESVEPLWKGPGLDEVLVAAEDADVTVVM